MITRGHFIGEIIDALAGIAEQVSMRTALGLTDLNRYLEDFFKEILNKTLSIKLVNLNDDRVNAPGLDLIDETSGIGFQITSTKTSSKVNHTLEKIVDLNKPPENSYLLIIGKKQNSYTLDDKLCKQVNFSIDNIWDVTDLARQLVSLPIDNLQSIYEYITKELVRVRIELEIPDTEGNYPTNISQYVEPVLTPNFGEFELLKRYLVSIEKSEEETWKNTFDDLISFINQLKILPRITREFYGFLLERIDNVDADRYGNCSFSYNRLKRICRYPDMYEELKLLEDAKLIWLEIEGYQSDRPMVKIYGQGSTGYIIVNLIEFASQNEISLQKVFATLDFSPFDKKDSCN